MALWCLTALLPLSLPIVGPTMVYSGVTGKPIVRLMGPIRLKIDRWWWRHITCRA